MPTQPAYNAWRLTALTPLPSWGLALVALALIAALWLSARGVASEPSRARKIVLIALRSLACLLVAALILEPGLELRAETRVRARIALLLDTSKSMRFPAEAVSAGQKPISRTQQITRQSG